MDRILPNKVEAVLLYDQLAAVSPELLLKLVNELSAEFGFAFERSRFERAGQYYHMPGNGLTIEVDYVDERIDAVEFEDALAANFATGESPSAAVGVEQHRDYAHIVIWNDAFEPADPITEEKSALPENFTGEKFDLAIKILRMLCSIHASQAVPLAIYWVQSDRLFDVREFLKVAIDLTDQSLLVHPIPYEMAAADEESGAMGLQTIGAASLVGKEIVFNPTRMPPPELYQCVLHFIALTKGTGLSISDGDVFGRSEGELIRVRHAEEPESHKEVIMLELEQSAEYDIVELPFESEEDEQAEVDPQDPVEIAMQERIRAMQDKTVEEVPSPEDAEVSVFRQELHTEAWNGVQKKVDIASLRSLTVTKKEVEEAEAARGGSKLLSKVSGLFQRS